MSEAGDPRDPRGTHGTHGTHGDGPAFAIHGRRVALPVHVRHATSGSAVFLVDARAAQRLLPAAGLEIPEILPRRALCTIAAIDYRDNDLGDYNEVSIAFFARPAGTGGIPYFAAAAGMARGTLGTYIHQLPVDQPFTCEAGRAIWGFPKSVQRIDLAYAPSSLTCTLVHDGRHALTLRVPRGGSKSLPEREMATYSFIEGVAHRTPFHTAAEGFGVRLGGAELTLGEGPLADELRGLGLPRRALFSSWMERMRARFGAAEKL